MLVKVMRTAHPQIQRFLQALACLLVVTLAACATARVEPTTTVDGRARFREIFCTVLYTRAADRDSQPACSETLLRWDDEPTGQSTPVDLTASPSALTVIYVAGLWSYCLDAIDSTSASQMKDTLARFGYDFSLLRVSGISSSRHNARSIRDALVRIPELGKTRRAVIVAHSKGVVDTLEALVEYAEVRNRVTAVISLAGAVGGSPLADPPPVELLQLISTVSGSGCREGDHAAIRSLRRDTRRAWVSRNALPKRVRYYSVVATPQPGRVSSGLRVSYELLRAIDPGTTAT